MLDSILTSGLTLPTFLICTAASLILGLLTALVCMYRQRCSRGFAVTLAILPAMVQMVILLVNGNIGAGVAVAGAFSLVRFRSVPGTAREIGAIFLAMAIGLATGMGYVALAAIFFVIVAAALLALFYPVFRSEQAMAKGMPWLLSAAVLLAVAFTFYMGGLRVDAAALDGSNFAHAQENAYKLLGAVIALLPVYFLEKRYVKFETGAVWYAQIAKLVLGLGLAMAVKSVLKAPLNALLPGGAGDAIRYFVLVLFAGCVWPMTFRWFGRWGKRRA